MFLPTTKNEMDRLGWDRADVIIVSGDAYADSPYIGAAVIGRVLEDAGFRVAIIAQPDTTSAGDITRLGEPSLFWGVTAGCIDSMVANRTASGKKRKSDDYTPGGVNDRRPDRASVAYTNLIRKHFKDTAPIVLGGMEASLRRIAHYDFWTDKIRRSVLFDSKADYLLYGMAERAVVELARSLRDGSDPCKIRGLCYASPEVPKGYTEIPSFKEAAENKKSFEDMFHTFYKNNDPATAKGLVQKHDTRFLVQNPPARYLSTKELDRVYALPFERELHPYYQKLGKVRALETIRFSIPTHRGCYGECSFCAIAVHEGRRVRSRSRASIVEEAVRIAAHPKFKGTIFDIGGPTANMFATGCPVMDKTAACPGKKCLVPGVCDKLRTDHGEQIKLLREIRKIKGVKRAVVASGVRYDMVMADKKSGKTYLKEVVDHHVSGQMKVAPEHSEKNVLDLMVKPDTKSLLKFKDLFYKLSKEADKKQFLTYYMIAAHPGCTPADMRALKTFCERELAAVPEQVQVFTPSPSTYSTLMYHTGRNPYKGGSRVFVERSFKGREAQKVALIGDRGRPGRKGRR